MWIFAMFDLPVVTNEQRKSYSHFVNYLKAEGFERIQFSVYIRYFVRACPRAC